MSILIPIRLILCSPILADNFGRKIPIAIGCLIMIAGGFVQGFSQSMAGMLVVQYVMRYIHSLIYIAFMGGRVMLGFGNSLAQIASPMLLTELCHPQHRGRLTAVYNCLWNVGSFSKWERAWTA